MLEINHRLLNAIVKVLDGFDKVQFFRKNNKLYVKVEHYKTFDNIHDFLETLTNYSVRELTDNEIEEACMEINKFQEYIGIVETD